MSLLKKDKFSIRKIKGIVGSVFLGSLLFAPSIVGASTYHYLDYSNLTQTERDQLKQGRPDESKESYALVYEKDALPNTGQSQSIMTVFGLLTIGSLVVVITKDKRNKKIATFLIVGATGLVTLSTASALNLNATIHESGRDGVLQISGYRYVGYLELDDRSVSSVSQASTVSPVEQPKVVTDKGEPEVQAALPEAIVTEKGEALVQPELPEAVVSEKVEPAVQPVLPEAVVSEKIEPAVHEKSEYTAPLSTVPDEAPKVEKTEYTAPVGTVPDEAPKTEKPEYTEPAGATGVDENGNLLEPPVSEKPAYTEPVGATGVDENGNLIEPPIIDIPEYTEPISTVSEIASEREELPSLHTDIRTETISKTTIEESEPTKFIGDDSVKQIGEDGERQIVTSYEELHGKKISEPVETVTILKEMKPEILVKGTKEKPKEKTAPVLTLERTDTNVLDRSANLSYHLVNTDGVKINKITATIKDGNEIVKTVDLTSEQLDKQVEDLKFYKDYKIETTMTYDRDKGEETATLEEKPLRLDLKKVEIKNIASTNLVKVNDDGTETPSDFMTEKPSDEDVKKMYLKITSRDNKVTRLAVDKIEELTEEGKKLYKITAEAQDLIQHTDPTKVRNKYVHYIEKPVPKVDNVYYNFKELIEDMQKKPDGEFKLGADLNATNTPTPNKSYVTNVFKGKLLSDGSNHFTIHNLARPLFARAENAHIHDINLGNVNINMPWADRTAPLGENFKNSTIENIKVTGQVVGNNDVTGMVNKLDESIMRNVAFIGKIESVGNKGWWSGGLVSESWRSNVDSSYVDANIKANNAKFGGLIAKIDHGVNPMDVKQKGHLTKSVVKGSMTLKTNNQSGGLIHDNYNWGWVENNISMMKVNNGEIMYGSGSVDSGDPDFGFHYFKNNVYVKDVASGNVSYERSKQIQGVDQSEADKRIATFNITADKYEITDPLVNRLNNLTTRDNEYKTTQDYDATREQAYHNIEKLQPFYNKEWIVNQGNRLATSSNLMTKEVLSVTGMKNGQFVTDLSDIDKIMVHYADGTKEEMVVTAKADSKVAQVKEYDVAGQNIVYTPNMVVKNRDKLIADVKERLSSVDLISAEVRALMDIRKKAEENTDARKDGYIRNLYLEESFAEVKQNLDKLVKSLIENEDHQLNGDDAAMKSLLKKVEDNKAKIMMGLTYLNRYYDIKYGDLSIKDMMMFKPDFYGKTPSVIDRLIQIGSREHFLKGDRTQDAYKEVIAGSTGKGDLRSFLDYNMRLFTEDKDLNDWFIHSAKNVYVVEPETSTEAFKDKRHRVFDGLNNDVHGRMILPLLNLKKAHIFMISTYNTMAYSSFEKYGKNTEEERKELKKRIDEVAKAQQTYLDFWSRLALPSVRNKLLKSEYMVPTPVWDNQSYAGIKDANRQGYGKGGAVVSPIRELFGPTDRWHQVNGAMGAMAKIYEKPWKDEQVYFMVTNMLDQFGISAFTHETTHINDRVAYFGGHNHRQGTDLEAFAQGMLQTPDKSTTNGEYGALGINMAYHRPNDGNQWYNPDPDKLQTRDQIDHYMKNYNEAMMMLDYAEAEAVLPKVKGDNSKWFKKIDRETRRPMDRNKLGAPHQWDKVRDLTDAEKATKLETIDDLVNNNFMTIHGNPGNKVFHPEDFGTAYVNVNMMAGIYGGNTSPGAPGSLSFKHNAFRMWGYFGYENGFIGYVSSKYQGEADKQNQGRLGDDFIIKKVSNNQFLNLEDWKKHWYHDVKARAEKGFTEITIDGQTIHNYNELKALFDKAVTEDLKKAGNYSNTENLKSKVFKALLKNTDGFFNQLFKKDI